MQVICVSFDGIVGRRRKEGLIQRTSVLGAFCHTAGDCQRGGIKANEALEVGDNLHREW